MSIPADELLDRIAAALRTEIGPAVEEPFAKTQAFMAAVVLGKLAGQLRSAESDARTAADERQTLVADLRDELAGAPAEDVGDALGALGGDGGDATWSRLVTALYAGQDELGAERFEQMLRRLRVTLRARLDRMLVYAA